MKKAKFLAIAFGLILSVVGIGMSKADFSNQAVFPSDCSNPMPVDDDCQVNHSGATCQISSTDVYQYGACSQLLKRTNP